MLFHIERNPPCFARLSIVNLNPVLMLSFPSRVFRNDAAPDRVSCVLESRFPAPNQPLVPQFDPRLSPRKPWPTRSRKDWFLPHAGDDSQQRSVLRTRNGLPSLIGGCSSELLRTRLVLLSGADQTSSRSKSCRRLHVVKRT